LGFLLPKIKLNVESPRGNPDPPQGTIEYDTGDKVSCKVTSPVNEGSYAWTCQGWSGTGSVPVSGTGTSVQFPIHAESKITWNWTKARRKLGAAQVITLVALAVIFLILWLSYEKQNVSLAVLSAGAIGGLVHEIVQSKGTYILPNTDDKGNFCLGGLIGVITGGLAGLILYQGLNTSTGLTVSGELIPAFLAGLALKGVADAVNPPSSKTN